MNLSHLKYVVVVAECGSISKAAEKLYIGQPNVSRAIKDLEDDLGIEIFNRSSRGIELTPNGNKLVKYAKEILKQVDDVENLFKEEKVKKPKISISAPRASYIGDAIASFSNKLENFLDLEIVYKETNSSLAIKNILEDGYNLAILRYNEVYDEYYERLFKEKGLKAEVITSFNYHLVMNKNNPLVNKDVIGLDDLYNQIEIAHADPYVPNLSLATVIKNELPSEVKKRIFVFERASQFEILSSNTNSFMWVSPIPEYTLDRYGLVERKIEQNTKVYKDVIIYKKDYELTKLDHIFISELVNSKRRNIK